MSTTTPTEIAIDFGAIEGKETEPKGPVDTAISRAASTGSLQTFSCRQVLGEAQLAQVATLASKLLPEMLADGTKLSNFGSSSLDGVNRTVSRILAEQTKLEIPEVSKLTKEMNHIVSDFRHKYNPDDPKVKKVFDAFDSWKQTIGNLIRGGRNLLDDLYEDSLTVEKSLDRSAGKLVEKRHILQRNVILCDELYVENEKAISQLIGVIAIMEQIRDNALAEAQTLQPKIDAAQENSPEKRDLTERQNLITEFIGDVEIRINEFVQRLFVAWTTSPQIRNIRKISYGLDQRLGLLVQLTIPTLKMTVAVWGSLVQAESAGKQKEEIDNLTNDALTNFANAAATSVPKIAQIIQAPSLRPETIVAMADSIVAQNKGIEDAVREGQRQRAEVTDAIVTAGQRITESTLSHNKTIIDLVARAQRPLELGPVPSVPEEVIALNGAAA